MYVRVRFTSCMQMLRTLVGHVHYECATGCAGILCDGHLWDGSYSEGAGRSLNWLRKGALVALHRLKGFSDATKPS